MIIWLKLIILIEAIWQCKHIKKKLIAHKEASTNDSGENGHFFKKNAILDRAPSDNCNDMLSE